MNATDAIEAMRQVIRASTQATEDSYVLRSVIIIRVGSFLDYYIGLSILVMLSQGFSWEIHILKYGYEARGSAQGICSPWIGGRVR
jgi:hypothetical protein